MNLIHALVVFLGGIFGGLYASSVGGGALVSLPLLLLIGLPPHLALGTQRLGAVLLEGVSAVRFYSAKKFDLQFAGTLGVLAAVGSAVGVLVVVHIDEKLLNLIIGGMLLLAALVLFNKDRLAPKISKSNRKNFIALALSTGLLGFYGGFFGAGFGVFMTIGLVLFGFSYMESAALSRVIGFFMSLAATLIFAKHGLINYGLGITLGLGFAIGSWIGIGVALKKSETYIKSLLLVIILLSLVKILLELLT